MIKRIPVTRSLPIEAIHPDLRMCVENLLPTSGNDKEKYHLIRELLKFQSVVSRRNATPTQTNKTGYGGELAHKSMSGFFDRVGIFNPTKYPVAILMKMREDPQIALGLGVIKGILRGLDWTIECADETQKRFLDFSVREIFPKMMQSLVSALEFGFSSNEIVWEGKHVLIADIDSKTQQHKIFYKRYSLLIKHIKDHHPNTIRVVVHPTTQEFIGINQTNVMGESVFLRKGLKLMFFGFDQEYGNWFGKSRMVNAYMAWYWGQIYMNFMAKYMERRGTPPLLITHPIGKRLVDNEELDAADIALRLGMAMISDSIAALPSEYDPTGKPLWDMKYLNDDKRAEMFEKILNYFDVLKLRGLCIPDRALAQDLTPGGTSAGSESSRDLLLITMSSLIQDLTKVINENIVTPLHNVNFLQERRVSARLVFQAPDFDRRKLMKEVFVEQIRQTPNFTNIGRLPDKVPDLSGIAKFLNFPIADIDVVYREATEEVMDTVSPPPNPSGTQAAATGVS